MESGGKMNFYHDRQIKVYTSFLILLSLFSLGAGLLFSFHQVHHAKNMYLFHDEAVASSLLEQGVSKEIIADALTNSEASQQGKELLRTVGIGRQTDNHLLPFISQFQKETIDHAMAGIACFILMLFGGTFFFFWKRERLYTQAEQILSNYIEGDYSKHLPQNSEGSIFKIFSLTDQLATMLQSKNETEHKTKEFLKNTISDISHQLKTPLAALMMYQEIMEAEPDHIDTVKEFSQKTGTALKRMEQLILSMLKITRLDAGNIIFEKRTYFVGEVIANAVNELTTRASHENKQIITEGEPDQAMVCDIGWTSEAIGNLVKNALDHTGPGGIIRITWENTPTMLRIFVSDNGSGIAPEDIHHIFKRFYRSRHSLDTAGAGLGLSLAKSIIEGQDGLISVQSVLHEGTTFTLSFLRNCQ